MATDKEVKLEQNEFYEPTEADKELTAFLLLTTAQSGVTTEIPTFSLIGWNTSVSFVVNGLLKTRPVSLSVAESSLLLPNKL
jgi:hypothetical protein